MEGRTVLPSGCKMSDLEKTHLYLLTLFKTSSWPICHIPVSIIESIRALSRSLTNGTSNSVENLMGEENR